jgi:hypothetical protein
LLLQTYFVDTTKPGTPSVTVTNSGSAVNGWHRATPSVKVSATDPSPSSGFEQGGLKLSVDGDEKSCLPAGSVPTGHAASTATCDLGTSAPVPSNGVHEFTAIMTDRLGNASDKSPVATMKVDTIAPQSSVVLSPAHADGLVNGVYKTRPAFGFTALDNPGGSGVDLTGKRATLPASDPRHLADDVSGVWFRIDGGTLQKYDPDADDTNRITDGEHVICWYAADIAGNKEGGGCKEIVVDATAPSLDATVDPSTPDGLNSWYVERRPVVNAQAGESAGGGATGIDTASLELQVDGGEWSRSLGDRTSTTSTAKASYTVQEEGVHEVRVRVRDRNGNLSPVVEKVLKIDRTKPTVQRATYPSAANSQGWYRRPALVSLSADDAEGGSGASRVNYRVDMGADTEYSGAFPLGEGTASPRTVRARTTDLAGILGDPVDAAFNVDSTAPVAQATGATGSSGLNGTATLRFDASDARTPLVRVRVHVYDITGKHIRTLEAAGNSSGYRAPGSGQVTWDGRNANGTYVMPGVYYHRVQVIDQAGNASISSESGAYGVLSTVCVANLTITVPTVIRLSVKLLC